MINLLSLDQLAHKAYCEDQYEISFEAKGFKDAQDRATKQLIQWIKKKKKKRIGA